MENVKNDAIIRKQAIEVFNEMCIDVQTAKTLVDDGREVKCSRKLQGVLSKLVVLEELLVHFLAEIPDADVATEDSA